VSQLLKAPCFPARARWSRLAVAQALGRLAQVAAVDAGEEEIRCRSGSTQLKERGVIPIPTSW
jgi:hypothetical protein